METNFDVYKSRCKTIVFTLLIILNIGILQAREKNSSKKVAVLVANNDDFSSNVINGLLGGIAGNVLANDTSDGAAATQVTVISSIISDGTLAGVTVSENGDINIPAGTPSRTFSVIYQICERGDASNCQSATVTIIVDADSDGDGILDSLDACNNFDDTLDNDLDGIPDACDSDDDNDGIPDINEGCTANARNTYQKIYFADGTIDTTAPTDQTLVYSTETDYVSIINGDPAPDNLLYLNGYDPIGGQAKMVLNVTDAYILNVDKFLVLRAYLFDNRELSPNTDAYDLPLLATLNTISSGVLSVEQFLEDEQIIDLDGGKWIEVEFKFAIPPALSGEEIFINNITIEIEVNNSGEGPNFIESYSEVFGIIPLDLTSDAAAQDCSASPDCDNDTIPNYQDNSACDVVITPNPFSDLIPNTFTPNGDGINDTFEIPALLQYLDFKLEIYNRWGNKVHDYSNNGNVSPIWWDGFSNGRLTLNNNKPLPIGTYYYIIDFNDGLTAPKQGWVYLNR